MASNMQMPRTAEHSGSVIMASPLETVARMVTCSPGIMGVPGQRRAMRHVQINHEMLVRGQVNSSCPLKMYYMILDSLFRYI